MNTQPNIVSEDETTVHKPDPSVKTDFLCVKPIKTNRNNKQNDPTGNTSSLDEYKDGEKQNENAVIPMRYLKIKKAPSHTRYYFSRRSLSPVPPYWMTNDLDADIRSYCVAYGRLQEEQVQNLIEEKLKQEEEDMEGLVDFYDNCMYYNEDEYDHYRSFKDEMIEYAYIDY